MSDTNLNAYNFSFINSLNLSSDVSRRLSLNLSQIVEGRSDVLRSPTGGDLSTDDILQGWDVIYQENCENIIPELEEIEMSNRSKFGPRSIAVPWSERKESVLETFASERITGALSLKPLEPANPYRLRPLTLEEAVKYLKPSTNSGLPFLIKKRNVIPTIKEAFSSLLERQDPCVLFTRTQEQGKTRAVWGYPIADTLQEMRFYRPLLDRQKLEPWRSALSTPESVDVQMTKIVKQSKIDGVQIVSMDMSAYDSTVKASLQTSAFKYIKSFFQSSYHDEIDEIARRFNTIGLITPDGIMNSPHGVPSGSTFTNEVDSIVQYNLLNLLAEGTRHFQIQGDDAVVMSTDIDKLYGTYADYGLKVNYEKSLVSDTTALYLQSLYNERYTKPDGVIGGVYPTYRALNRIIHPERFDDFSNDDISGQDYFAIKNLTILENCKNHPCFVNLVKYIIKLDKYSLNVSDQGLSSYVKLRAKQDGKDVTFSSWSYGEDIKGLKAFESYKIVKELNV